MKLSAETVHKLQLDVSCIRNVCILAHVDHGKTSLSDSLLSTNGIISPRMAGKIRYLDSREDEQLRGITMESSAISLYFKVMRQKEDSVDAKDFLTKEYIINLIDSPGHIDFSSEVSTASRLCDGSLVLVDVIEGVCSQTINVLRQCWIDGLKPLLVLNKIDRLITEWRYTPLEAYQHLSRVIEQVNSIIGLFYAGERMEDDMIWREKGLVGEFVEKDDKDIYFSPEKNNVIFSSAIDGWAFSLSTFAKIYLAKLGFSHNILSKTLWGDYYLDMKNKKIVPGKKMKNNQPLNKPLFVSLILDQLWSIYENCVLNRNQDKLEKIIEKLGARINPRDLRSKEYKKLLNILMSQWLPISHAILGAVIEYLPSPDTAQSVRMPKILDQCWYDVVSRTNSDEKALNKSYEDSILHCDKSSPEERTLAYISKMISIPNSQLDSATKTSLTQDEILERGRKARELAKKASEEIRSKLQTVEDDLGKFEIAKDSFGWEFEEDPDDLVEEDDDPTEEETLLAFTRVYSGSLRKGQKIITVGPKYDPTLRADSDTNKSQITREIEIRSLYLFMGRELVEIDEVPAGCIVGVVGLGDIVLKNATIFSNDWSIPFINLSSTSTIVHNKPIMRIAIEPHNPIKLEKLERGLDLLAKADPVLEWYTDDESGEIIMCVAGELHLERCLKDLEERFAKGCEVVVKEPVIPFREGLASISQSGVNDAELPVMNGVIFELDTVPLPKEIVDFLISSEQEINMIVNHRGDGETLLSKKTLLKENLITNIKKFGGLMASDLGFQSDEALVENIICFGPKRIGPNIFIEFNQENPQMQKIFQHQKNQNHFELESSILSSFQLATKEGPLASEPMQGIVVVLRRSEVELESDEDKKMANISGKVITHVRDLIHKTYLKTGPRLFLAMYTCEIQASPEVLGRVNAVVQKRGGSIISEEMKEGTPFFTIEARIPVVEAFGFSEDIRKRTSGAASPQLFFDGYDMLDTDPFWVPHTEEDLETLGEFAERENVARKYMNQIRKRKGLFIDEKVVKNAEKQRTLKKD